MPTASMRASFVTATLLASAFGFTTLPAQASPGHGESIGAPAKSNPATRTINVELGDTFFKPTAIKVRAGETIRFVLTNSGELLHEFNIGTAVTHAKHQKEMMAMMEAGMLTATDIVTDHANMGHGGGAHGAMMKHDDPNSVLLRPGETKELIWRFAGGMTLEFACNVPGHYEAGMVGELKVL